MPSLTFYRDDGRAANGHTYRQNAAIYRYFCASNHHPLGTVLLLTSRGGRRLRVTVADRVGHGTDYDLNTRAARKLMGPKYRSIGRMPVRVRVLFRPHSVFHLHHKGHHR